MSDDIQANAIDTGTVSVEHQRLDYLIDMVGDDQHIAAGRLLITTRSGRRMEAVVDDGQLRIQEYSEGDE